MLSVASWVFVGVALTLFFHFLWKSFKGEGQGNLPPGPPRLPLLGNLGLFFGDDRHHRIASTGKRYGGIFTMKMGAVKSVWITSYKYMREAMIDNTWEFAGRPHEIWARDETTDRNPGILASGVDEMSRNVRKFTLISLRSFGFGKTSMQEAILRDSEEMNEEFRKLKGQPFNPRDILANAAANVIASVSLGRTFKQGDEELRSVNDSITNGVKQVLNSQRDKMFPFMRYFPMKSRQLLNDSFRVGKQFFVNIVNEHVATRETGNPRDLIDVWLDEVQKDGKSAADFPLERLPNVLLDLFAGGFETTTTTFQWAFAMLLHHPEVQNRIHDEIDTSIGQGTQITLENRDLVPYTDAVILETLRMYPPAPFAVPHLSTEEATLAGYRLPKGTRLMLHLYAIQRDPELWEAPEEFRPERFLQDGKLKIPEFFVPFGAGRRSCIGEQLARKELFLLFANILQSFRIAQPVGEKLPSLDLMQAVVMHPRPFNIRMEER